jgi:hypothetical protein
MATFLVTPKMNPALAARVEASVRGRRAAAEPRPALVVIARLAGLGVTALLVAALAFAFERRASEREAARAELMAAIEEQARGLDEKDLQLLDRAEATLIEETKVSSDIVADTLRDDAALDALIGKPAVYVNGDRAAFASGTTLWQATRESVKDAFVMCLFDPPSQRDEKALLSKVRTAYAGGIEARSRNVQRLGAAADGLPFLSRAWLKITRHANEQGWPPRRRSSSTCSTIRRSRVRASSSTAPAATACRWASWTSRRAVRCSA